jgi:hemerythrin-like domain-containing protein
MREPRDSSRRAFIRTAAMAGAGVILGGCAADQSLRRPAEASQAPGAEAGVSPAEDLMREHGVLRRILLVYEEAARRLEAGGELPPQILPESAGLVRTFIEQYHEKLEEDFLFPRFRKANTLVDLVEVLVEQHKAGRRLTDAILRLGGTGLPQAPEDRRTLARTLRQFLRMYRPHAAREDTVLFPAFRRIVSVKEYDDLGEAFEDKEHELFGEQGFEKMVDRVALLEKALGIDALGQFTPGG